MTSFVDPVRALRRAATCASLAIVVACGTSSSNDTDATTSTSAADTTTSTTTASTTTSDDTTTSTSTTTSNDTTTDATTSESTGAATTSTTESSDGSSDDAATDSTTGELLPPCEAGCMTEFSCSDEWKSLEACVTWCEGNLVKAGEFALFCQMAWANLSACFGTLDCEEYAAYLDPVEANYPCQQEAFALGIECKGQ